MQLDTCVKNRSNTILRDVEQRHGNVSLKLRGTSAVVAISCILLCTCVMWLNVEVYTASLWVRARVPVSLLCVPVAASLSACVSLFSVCLSDFPDESFSCSVVSDPVPVQPPDSAGPSVSPSNPADTFSPHSCTLQPVSCRCTCVLCVQLH